MADTRRPELIAVKQSFARGNRRTVQNGIAREWSQRRRPSHDSWRLYRQSARDSTPSTSRRSVAKEHLPQARQTRGQRVDEQRAQQEIGGIDCATAQDRVFHIGLPPLAAGNAAALLRLSI